VCSNIASQKKFLFYSSCSSVLASKWMLYSAG
jgi:hypothetical protein